MKSLKVFFASIVMLLSFFSCVRHNGNTEKSGTCHYGVDLHKDTLTINSSSIGSHVLSYSILGKPYRSNYFTSSISLDLVQLIRKDVENLNEYAYALAKSGSIPIHFTVGTQIDTTIALSFNLKPQSTDGNTRIISGPCLRLLQKSSTRSQEGDIKKWLYNRGTHADDATIHKMANALNLLTASTFNEFIPEEGFDIPVLKDFNGIQYKISTNVKSDYYYLFAADSYSEINDFIAEIVSKDFLYAERSSDATFSCFRTTDKGGLLTIFLVAVNKDWSKTVVPLGLVSIDNIKPSVSMDRGESVNTAYSVRLLYDNDKKTDESGNSLLFKELNDRVIVPKNVPTIAGHVDVSTGQFRGDNAQFTISFSGDVESITIKREIHRTYSWLKPELKTIALSGQTSPMHFKYELDLGIGDNYIPITVKDKRGNETNISYHIEMVQLEKTNPEINIDNNIDIWN